jgi:hypothetical protein
MQKGGNKSRTQHRQKVPGPIVRLTSVRLSCPHLGQEKSFGVRPQGFVGAKMARGWFAGMVPAGSITFVPTGMVLSLEGVILADILTVLGTTC